jgi:hypothetical protein
VALLLRKALNILFLADHTLDDCWSEGARRLAHVPLAQMRRAPQMAKREGRAGGGSEDSPRISSIINTLFSQSKC